MKGMKKCGILHFTPILAYFTPVSRYPLSFSSEYEKTIRNVKKKRKEKEGANGGENGGEN